MKTAETRKRDRGQALIFTAVALLCLMGFLALATDVGLLFRNKVNLQKVADAAAIAGAAELLTGASGNYTAAAQDSAKQNGVTDGTNGTVTVSLGTPYHPDAVKVYVLQPETTIFMHLFGFGTINVGATAVAGLTNGNGCLYAMNLDPFKDQGMTVDGTGIINAPQCTIIDNSGLNMNGTSGSITAKSVQVSGPYSPGNVTPPPHTGAVPSPDPLSYWSSPDSLYATCPNDPHLAVGQAIPGCYKGLTVSAPATLAPGLYVIQGALNLSNVTATGVTFYLDGAKNGALGNVDGSNLSAPTTGTSGTCTTAGCNGMLIWDSEINNPDKPQQGISFGPSNATLTGILYFPHASLRWHGNVTTTLNASIVASAFIFDGTVNLNNYVLSEGQDPLFETPTIVE